MGYELLPLRNPPHVKTPGINACTVKLRFVNGGKLALFLAGEKFTQMLLP
jgi:hypothetical protein